MPKDLMIEMGSQVGLTPVNRNQRDEGEPQDYDPYENRVVKKPTTNTETLVHLLKGSLGTGILAMPHAFSNSGYAIGVIGTILIGVLCTYCIHILIDSVYTLCKRRKIPSMTYTVAAEAALSEGPAWCKAIAPYAGHVVNVFLLIYQIGTCCVYVVFVAENLKAIVDTQTGSTVDVKLIMLGMLIPLMAINYVRELKYLVPFSGFANILTVFSFGIIMYYMFKDVPSLEGKKPVGHPANFPLFFGTVLFALEAIGVIMPLENEMKTPKDFVSKFGVLNKAMSVIIFLYVGMGLFGYLRFGDESAGSITLNLPGGEWLAQTVQGLLAIAIYITHGLACYVAIEILWKEYIESFCKTRKLTWEYVMRTSIVLVTIAVAAAVPALDLFISLFGALCLSALGLAFPAIIQTTTYWYYVSDSERIRMVIKNACVVTFGILGLVIGTYTALDAIVIEFFGGNHVIEHTSNGTLEAGSNSSVEYLSNTSVAH